MKLNLELLRESDYKKWDDFVNLHPNSTIFHTIQWKTIIEDSFHYQPLYLVLKNSEDKIVGISPSFLVTKLGILNKIIISLPFFEYGGLLIQRGYEEGYSMILNFYKEQIRSQRVKYIEIKPGINNYEEYNDYFTKEGFQKTLQAFDFYIDIKDKDFERNVWLKLIRAQSRVRNSVKKAMKSGVIIRDTNDIDIFYSLYLKTIERLGSLPLPKILFTNIQKYCHDSVKFTIAYFDNKPISALLSFLYNKRDLMVELGSDYVYQQYRPNDLLYCNEIKYAIENQFKIIDFGRTRPNSSYESYKKKWGATRLNLDSYIYPSGMAQKVNLYRLYLLFSPITKNNCLWKIITRTKIARYLIRRLP